MFLTAQDEGCLISGWSDSLWGASQPSEVLQTVSSGLFVPLGSDLIRFGASCNLARHTRQSVVGGPRCISSSCNLNDRVFIIFTHGTRYMVSLHIVLFLLATMLTTPADIVSDT